MFQNEDDFKKIVSRLDIDEKPNPTHRESLRGRMLSVFDKSGEQPQTQSMPLRRTIMKSPIPKLAAAAGIIIAVLIGIHQFGGSIDGTTVALAQVKEAMEKVNWLRGINESSSGLTEQWYSFESQIEILKEQTGKVTYYNYGENRKCVYEPGNNTITVSYIPGDGFALGAASPFALLEELIKREQDRGAELVRKAGQYDDTEVEIWELMRSEESGIENIKVYIDIKKHLLIAAEVKYININGEIGYEGNVKFEYPETGPRDIYDLEVPQSAKIIDETDVSVAKATDESKQYATDTAVPKLVPIEIKLPRPMFVGTPQDAKTPNLERPLGRDRPQFYAPIGTKNVALGKPVFSTDEEPFIGEIEMITDGDKEAADGSFVELDLFKQHVTIDLEAEYNIYAIVIWHYHKQAWVFFDVAVQVANEPDFITNVRTLFNNDIDNSLGLGVGKDMHYTETAEGKLIDAKGTVARYVRLYSNGSTGSDVNYYIEVEVYGKAAE